MSQSSIHTIPLHGTAGFDYRASSSSHSSGPDAPYATGGPDLSMSPLPSSRGSSSASPNSIGSSYALLPHHHGQYGLNNNVSYNLPAHPSAPAGGLYASGHSYPQNVVQSSLELRSGLNPIPATSGMPPPSRYSSHPIPASPPARTSIRNDYAVTGPHVSRQGFHPPGIYQLSPSHSPMSIMPRSLDSSLGHESPSAVGLFAAPHDAAVPNSAQLAPPFDNTKSCFPLRNQNNQEVRAEITARIEKGFFKAEDEWVCYRRNYFTVLCTFEIQPSSMALEPIFLQLSESQMPEIHSFFMTISAKADSEDGKSIDLVQHTPKRDKGPTKPPEPTTVKPNPGSNLGSTYPAASAPYPGQGLHEYEVNSEPEAGSSQVPQPVASFERIQFKKATANNGKRRAAQQYFFLVVELWCKFYDSLGKEHEVKIAQRVSSKVVVRGRSPGHYKEDRRTSASGGGSGQMGYDGGHGHFGGGSMDASLAPSPNAGGYPRSGPFAGPHSAVGRSSYLANGPPAPSPAMLSGINLRSFPDEYMEVDSAPAESFYTDHDFGSLPSPPTPRASQTLRQSSNNSPSSLHSTGYGYLTPLSMKEELRMPSVKGEEDRTPGIKGAGLTAPPWVTADLGGTPRDCRSLALESPRGFYPATSAM